MDYKPEYTGFACERQGHVMVVTMNRPKELNIFRGAIMRDMQRLFTAMDTDMDVRCVVLTGEGKAFCAGADLAEEADYDLVEIDEFAALGRRMVTKIVTFRTPVIAAINGYALGGGFEYALAADYRIASENASMGLPEVTLGTFAGWGGLERLMGQVRPSTARRLLYTGCRVKGEEACQLGLVDEVVPAERLMERAMELAGQIALNPPRAVAVAKRYARELEGFVVADGMKVYESDDLKEAFAAFFEKRPARPFTGQ